MACAMSPSFLGMRCRDAWAVSRLRFMPRELTPRFIRMRLPVSCLPATGLQRRWCASYLHALHAKSRIRVGCYGQPARPALRGGSGMFYDSRMSASFFNIFSNNSPFITNAEVKNVPFANPYVNTVNPFPCPAATRGPRRLFLFRAS